MNKKNVYYPELTAVMIFHHEWFDVYRCLKEFRTFYPHSEIILARDSLKPVLPVFLEEFSPTLLSSYNCMQILIELNWNFETCKNIPLEERVKIIGLQLERLYSAARISKNDHLLALEYDAHIRAKVPVIRGVDVESSAVNKIDKNVIDYINGLSANDFPLDGYGFVVGTFSKQSAFKAFEWYKKNINLVKELAEIEPRLVYLDCLFPIFAHISGSVVSNNKLTVECKRDRFWRFKKTPLVHQYRGKKFEHRDYAISID
jgi:hypothetical protein